MRTIITLTVIMTLFAAIPTVLSQPDTVKIKERALFFSDSLIKTDAYKSWSDYADLAPSSVWKYYGGKDGFIEHFKKIHPRTVSGIDENCPEREVITLMTKDDQWQCVIRVSRYIHREDLKKYHIVTYLLGQSRDEGETWRLFDVSYNSVANIIYLMPDVLGDLPIPQPFIISEEEELAKQQAAAPVSKKAAPRRK